LEAVHDYIQWLFPLPEPSPVNPSAPVIDAETVAAFQAREDLRSALLQSMRVMVEFYGFQILGEPIIVIEPAAAFDSVAANWLTPGNHNHLRITRILRSTRILGLPEASAVFFQALSVVYRTNRGRAAIGLVSFRFWQQAVS
jgi:hypothetical protein